MLDGTSSRGRAAGGANQTAASFGAQDTSGIIQKDNLAQAQQKVAQTTELMQMNVQRMINNQNELGDIEQRAGDLKNIAFNVRNSAEQLRKEAARRNTRLMITVGLVGISLLAYIIIPLASSDD